MDLAPHLLQSLLDAAPEGAVLCDARSKDMPVVYANRAMEALTGYPIDEIVGRNMRFLQADDRDQEGLGRLRKALKERSACQALLRNYRKDGSLFWNELKLVPIRDAQGELTHFASFHREGYERLRPDSPNEQRDPMLSTQSMLAYVRDDKLTGLMRRSYFEDLLKRDWGLAQRESRLLTLIVFDLDYFDQYREVFGRSGADQTFRRIAKVIHGCLRRASDLCGRWDEQQIVALTVGMENEQALRFAESILGRIRDLGIHHPRSVSRFVSASAGVSSLVPPHDTGPDKLIEMALSALAQAKENGRGRAACAPAA